MPETSTKPDRKTRKPLLVWHPDTLETLNAHPDNYSPITSKSRLKSYRYAMAGWLYMLRYQKNTRIQAVFSIAVFVVALWLGLPPRDWAVLILIITINWMAEFINAALEAAVNLATPAFTRWPALGRMSGRRLCCWRLWRQL